MSGETSYRPV
ncbi:uncharacterized protein FTOL_13990 [Fusarium torulosum]|uniref:Uncharacterized protein n=1 Tax=Fusarium torulosum TaxID=33205 RepID=A0AAE8MQF8_9HYPO|nr:uncharacterized protein FTOL_13990 [Fusarium torulosum]